MKFRGDICRKNQRKLRRLINLSKKSDNFYFYTLWNLKFWMFDMSWNKLLGFEILVFAMLFTLQKY